MSNLLERLSFRLPDVGGAVPGSGGALFRRLVGIGSRPGLIGAWVDDEARIVDVRRDVLAGRALMEHVELLDLPIVQVGGNQEAARAVGRATEAVDLSGETPLDLQND